MRRGPAAEAEMSQLVSSPLLPPCPREKPLGPWETSLEGRTRAGRVFTEWPSGPCHAWPSRALRGWQGAGRGQTSSCSEPRVLRMMDQGSQLKLWEAGGRGTHHRGKGQQRTVFQEPRQLTHVAVLSPGCRWFVSTSYDDSRDRGGTEGPSVHCLSLSLIQAVRPLPSVGAAHAFCFLLPVSPPLGQVRHCHQWKGN